jgi:antitoxin HicB
VSISGDGPYNRLAVSYRSRQRVRHKQREQPPLPSSEERRVEDYARLPYPVSVVRDDEGRKPSWVASVEDLPGCTSRGRTPEIAVSGVSDAVTAWVEAAIREGREVPEPKSRQSHSGRLLLRMPQTLHAELSRVAEREGASLNQFITDVLAAAVAWRAPSRASRAETGAGQPTVQRVDEGRLDDVTDREPVADSRPSSRRRSRWVTAALVANLVLVAAAAVVAILVLIAAWR